jgi:hypothetical protein
MEEKNNSSVQCSWIRCPSPSKHILKFFLNIIFTSENNDGQISYDEFLKSFLEQEQKTVATLDQAKFANLEQDQDEGANLDEERDKGEGERLFSFLIYNGILLKHICSIEYLNQRESISKVS